MLHLLIDTSTWFDLAKRRNGQKWIVTLRVLWHQKWLELLVPEVVIDEFERNRPRIESSMAASVSERFRLIKQDLTDYGGDDLGHALEVVEGLAHQVPLIGAMTTRNLDEIAELLLNGKRLRAGEIEHRGVVARGLDKAPPFHRSRNSVADALLIELYSSAVMAADLDADPHAFVTTNSADFSLPKGDDRQPHPGLAGLFRPPRSTYALGVEGLDAVLLEHLREEVEELYEESDFEEEPRRLDEIQAAEQEMFDRISYQRSLNRLYRQPGAREDNSARRRQLEEKYGPLGPYSDFEWGMLNGKMSALRWVLGSEWDFLDT